MFFIIPQRTYADDIRERDGYEPFAIFNLDGHDSAYVLSEDDRASDLIDFVPADVDIYSERLPNEVTLAGLPLGRFNSERRARQVASNIVADFNRWRDNLPDNLVRRFYVPES